jgi:hypothetical protein
MVFFNWIEGILGLDLQINTCEFGPADLYFGPQGAPPLQLICRYERRSGFKTPSEAQWLRCRPPINAHIPTRMLRFLDRLAPCP